MTAITPPMIATTVPTPTMSPNVPLEKVRRRTAVGAGEFGHLGPTAEGRGAESPHV